MISNIRAEMESGHPQLLSQAAISTVRKFISVDNSGDTLKFKSDNPNEKDDYSHYQLYWVGWMYAYLHFQTKLSSKELIEKLPLDTMLEHYYLGHEISKESYFSKVKHILI